MQHQERSWRFGKGRVHITVAWGQIDHPADVFVDYGISLDIGRLRLPLTIRFVRQEWEIVNG